MKYISEVYGKGGIYAKCVAASITNGVPIYTLETKAPKFIDAEFEKHRMLSSNSSSSRAIPFKYLEEVYLPSDIRENQKGMQGYTKVKEEVSNLFYWNLNYLKQQIEDTLTPFKDTVHKQHLNRYLEPFMFQKKVITATEWDNFFRLRLAPDAQPEIQELAGCMKEAIDHATCTELKPGQWHLPYIDLEIDGAYYSTEEDWKELSDGTAIACSVARCARVSYFNTDNSNPSVKKDMELYDKLLSSGHLTPFEHQASPMLSTYTILGSFPKEKGTTHMDKNGKYWSGNFKSWVQYRQLVSNWNG